MFGLSFGEIVIVAILALLLLGPDKLPDAAKQAGKLMRELRKATDDLRDQIETEMNADVRRPATPKLVPPVPASPSVDAAPAGPPPPATAENIPGLDAALAEPGVSVAPEPPPAPAPPDAPPAPGEKQA